jgi:hypothetical protein
MLDFLVHVGALFHLGTLSVLVVTDLCALLATDFMWEPRVRSWLLIYVGVRPKIKLDRFFLHMWIGVPQKHVGE